MRKRYDGAKTMQEFIAAAEENQELWASYYERAQIPDEMLERARALPGTWHLLVLAEDWCGDAYNSVPYIARLADMVETIDLRILERDQNLDLMDAHLTNGGRSIPKVLILDEHYEERADWGPRPAALQQWFLETGKQMEKEDRYREIRRWYARDRGKTTLDEVLTLLEAAEKVVA